MTRSRAMCSARLGLTRRTSARARSMWANAAPAVTPGLALQIGFGSFKRRGYAGPRPIPGHGPHRYIFQIFALDRPSGLDYTATLPRALSAIDGKVIARGRLTGTYERARFRRNDAG